MVDIELHFLHIFTTHWILYVDAQAVCIVLCVLCEMRVREGE